MRIKNDLLANGFPNLDGTRGFAALFRSRQSGYCVEAMNCKLSLHLIPSIALLSCWAFSAFSQERVAAEEKRIFAAVIRYQRHFSAEDSRPLFVSLYGKTASTSFLRPLQDRKHTLHPMSEVIYVKRNPTFKTGQIPADRKSGVKGSVLDITEINWVNSKLVQVSIDLFSGGIDGMHTPYTVSKKNGRWQVERYLWK